MKNAQKKLFSKFYMKYVFSKTFFILQLWENSQKAKQVVKK